MATSSSLTLVWHRCGRLTKITQIYHVGSRVRPGRCGIWRRRWQIRSPTITRLRCFRSHRCSGRCARTRSRTWSSLRPIRLNQRSRVVHIRVFQRNGPVSFRHCCVGVGCSMHRSAPNFMTSSYSWNLSWRTRLVKPNGGGNDPLLFQAAQIIRYLIKPISRRSVHSPFLLPHCEVETQYSWQLDTECLKMLLAP